MKLMQKTLLASLLLASVMSNAYAATVTYDYVGNDFNIFTAFDPITGGTGGSATLSAVLGPKITGSVTYANGIENGVTSYMLTDSKNTLDNSNSNIPLPFNMTFLNNSVDTWTIVLNTTVNDVFVSLATNNEGTARDQSYRATSFNGVSIIDVGDIVLSPGLWTLRQEQVSSVPVPATLPLMASALGLFGWARGRKQAV